MNPLLVGIIAIVILMILLCLRVPIAVSMILVGIAGYCYIVSIKSGIGILGRVPYIVAASYDLSQIPLFILMGHFALYSGSSAELYQATYKWLGRLPGGLAISTIGASAAFSSICGSSTATTATIGAVALPEMEKYHYNPGLACAATAAGGTLGILVPPSIILIIYAMLTEQSIGKLFVAGILPGILLGLLFMLTIYLLTKRNPRLAPPAPHFSLGEKLLSIRSVWSVAILFILVIIGIYTGVFTPSEAAGVGSLGALLVSLVRRRMTAQNFIAAVQETVKVTGMAFLILIGASIFGYFLAVTEMPMKLAAFVAELSWPPLVVMIAICVVLFIMGFFMDSMSIVILMIPILYPMILRLGFDPLWFGIMTVVLTELGLLTPPVGPNVFVIAGIAKDVPMHTIFRSIIPFVITGLIFGIILLVFPQIALFLPDTM
jgi:tripartite ATP-independent transporter DctM subunit